MKHTKLVCLCTMDSWFGQNKSSTLSVCCSTLSCPRLMCPVVFEVIVLVRAAVNHLRTASPVLAGLKGSIRFQCGVQPCLSCGASLSWALLPATELPWTDRKTGYIFNAYGHALTVFDKLEMLLSPLPYSLKTCHSLVNVTLISSSIRRTGEDWRASVKL